MSHSNLRAVLLCLLLPTTLGFGSLGGHAAATDMYTTVEPDMSIACPFLRIVRPRMSSLEHFIQDISEGGVERKFATVLGGFVADVQGRPGQAPDIHQLFNTPGLSHDDMFLSRMDGVKQRLEDAVDEQGNVSQQDLVDIKVWVAEQTGVESIGAPSQLETYFAFMAAGGDMDADKVNAMDVFRFIQGRYKPENVAITLGDTLKALSRSQWPETAATDTYAILQQFKGAMDGMN